MNYGRCEEVEHSERTVVNYWLRYCPWALEFDDFETLARIHNGGPQFWRHIKTARYWSVNHFCQLFCHLSFVTQLLGFLNDVLFLCLDNSFYQHNSFKFNFFLSFYSIFPPGKKLEVP